MEQANATLENKRKHHFHKTTTTISSQKEAKISL
jgi:hypothetical protein